MLIKSNQRVAIIGKTGSGKSYLIRKVSHQFKRVLFFDPKHEHGDLKGQTTHTVETTKKVLEKKDNFFIIYQPYDLSPETWNEVCEAVFRKGNMVVVMDEVERWSSPRVVEWHDKIIRMGRTRGIGIIHLIQRPAFIDNYILSESEHFIIFNLNLESDRKKVEGVIGEVAEKARDLTAYHFLYYSPLEREARICNPV